MVQHAPAKNLEKDLASRGPVPRAGLAVESRERQLEVDVPTLIALSTVAWALADVLHEVVGHAGAAVLLGVPVRAVSTTTAYIAAAGGIATLDPPMARSSRLWIACGVCVVAGFLTWVAAHKKALAAAGAAGEPPPRAGATFRAAWFEIVAAIVACFAWLTAVPPSWFDWGRNVVYAPALMVFVVSAIIGGTAVLLRR